MSISNVSTLISQRLNAKEQQPDSSKTNLTVCTGANPLTKRFGDAPHFMQVYSMTRALSYVRDAERCVTGNAPMLCEVKRFYDETTVLSWLEMQIIALSELCGAKGKISELQAKFCAEQILSEYGFLKVTEVLLYF